MRARKLQFECCDLTKTKLNNINLTKLSISDANLSEMKIHGAQWGGAHFWSIGDHNPSDPDSKPHPEGVRFTDCLFAGGIIENSDLTNLKIENCQIEGLTINGIRIDQLLKQHAEIAAAYGDDNS